MSLLKLNRKTDRPPVAKTHLSTLLKNYSIEVMPRTAQGIRDFHELLPSGTRVYVAHIGTTPIEEMVATAKRLSDEGYGVMPARIIKNKAMLADWIARYQGQAGISQALLLAGGVDVAKCVFRCDAPTYSDLTRPPIPILSARGNRAIRPPL